jgi:hypothetical protein
LGGDGTRRMGLVSAAHTATQGLGVSSTASLGIVRT